MTEPRAHYEERRRVGEAAVAAAVRRGNVISLARLAVFVGIVCFGAASLWGGLAVGPYVAGALGVVFVVLVVWHARVATEEADARAALRFVERGFLRLDGRVAELPPRGEALAAIEHPYASDLDLYGRGSVLAVLDAIETDLSEKRLGAWLGEKGEVGDVVARQDAARELAAHPIFAERLYVRSRALGERSPDGAVFLTFCEAPAEGPSPLWVGVSFALPLVTAFLAFAGPRLGLPGWAWIPSFVAHYLVLRAVAGRVLEATGAAAQGARLFGAYAGMVAEGSAAKWQSTLLAHVVATLEGEGRSATAAMRDLDRLVSFAEARENGFVAGFFGPAILLDLHLLNGLLRFRARYGKRVRPWLDAIGELSALAGLGVHAFENPTHTFPEIVDGELTFRAEGLTHPLLAPTKRVANDVAFAGPGTALLVTGSNMSGKSTLMRSVGVAVAMGLAGAPIAAKSATISRATLRTSMRIKDSLGSGVSHFYAELLALARVVEAADAGLPVLFLLDEILHGTNSRERHIGASAVLRHLLERGAMGAVSTHDLALTDLADEGAKVRPVHLMEHTRDGEMTFDYKLRDGVLRSGNALKLMRKLGLPVPPDDLAEG